jgi:hypothetical protein
MPVVAKIILGQQDAPHVFTTADFNPPPKLFCMIDPDRAKRDDLAVGGYNIDEKGKEMKMHIKYQVFYDQRCDWELKNDFNAPVDKWLKSPKMSEIEKTVDGHITIKPVF